MFRRYCIALLLTLLTACSPPQEPLRIGLNAWPGYEFLHLAEQLGYFRDEGVAVRIVTFSSLADSLRAFERGQLDMMGSTLIEPLLARDTPGVQPVFIYVVDYSNGGDMLLARQDIPDIGGLRGKTLALEGRTVDVLTAHYALASAGLRFADVQVHNYPQANGVQAFLDGKVDAIQTYPPFAYQLLNSGRAHRLFDTRQVPGKVIDVLVASHAAVDGRSAELAAVLRAFNRAREYWRQHPEQADAIMAEREGLSVADFRAAMAGIKLLGLNDQEIYLEQGGLQQALNETHQVLQQLGQVKSPPCMTGCISAVPLQGARR
ncbi:ABC transporter substrate-binding protein [Chitinilyticum piscinae]|uniref:ABC transporter substrate-binding protein n=1 Tax=Chitinilyticum piscinae TaxID=2866724 RepID=A0A8J7FIS3_9NEIS|nr:ABC transporter substrate-binding protein [Chitinilyticum piscinae]MBE9608202.1 ABC transporter substrate-binding protein [Chitinilyticum piscinae]